MKASQRGDRGGGGDGGGGGRTAVSESERFGTSSKMRYVRIWSGFAVAHRSTRRTGPVQKGEGCTGVVDPLNASLPVKKNAPPTMG
ncbi:hypothetical protein QE152_g4504 [Popillia japonica]|uniref:Uncharacterized protein n=1 Tax=Popillia japonica TaxID=7064 RepID=A0AAW1MVS0_POPJA